MFEFDYQSPLETDAACKTYLATLKNTSTQVVVKFVETYGEEAHKAMVDVGFAPTLLYCGPIQPGDLHNLTMVVMEYVSMRDPAHMQGAPELLQLHEIINTLHAKGFVFGDLRLPNIVITDKGQVQLIDFDWAGEEHQVRYPISISTAIRWAEGVKGLGLIKKEHDWFMLGQLLKS